MKLAWATDIHLDHATESARRFCQSVNEQADALVVTGDIAESHILGSALESLATLTERPVYFVLCNHDFYRGSVTGTHRQVGYVVGEGLVFLPSRCGRTNAQPALVGHGDWADGQLGGLDGSDVILNDFLLIDEPWRRRRHDSGCLRATCQRYTGANRGFRLGGGRAGPAEDDREGVSSRKAMGCARKRAARQACCRTAQSTALPQPRWVLAVHSDWHGWVSDHSLMHDKRLWP